VSYRDDHESARASAERLERELERTRTELDHLRRRRPFHALPFLAATLLGLVAVSVAAMPQAPPPSPPARLAPEPSAPPPAPPSPSPAVTSTAAPVPISRFFHGTIVKSDGEPRAALGAACTISVRASSPICLVTIRCGDYQPFPGAAFASCAFDDHGLPRGEMHYASPAKSPSDLSMDRGRLTLADTRSGQESVVEIKLRADTQR
jgi:hypothetical protein